ncbi:hypothetical protein [Marinobacter qingdaonensis]|uniref:Uncharacterized protein n=1 Tax=Marinobacter qingdaonensis TaxID=3108486 RepID=A0ABU5NZ67_9GAMM|nr:hypothetical protein [Marinobacter sp. ASW11-75]MEA1081099.1 hypothetical protein [Marinobacter sp. ASW11-75]MEE3118081.1 hypothetical protein [Pseudomonadota bacterium]
MNWLSQHHQSITALTSIATLMIWLVYAQLLYKGYRRQRRPRLIINRGKSKDINALCIISNMSAEPVFIEYIVAELQTSHGTIVMDVTDLERGYDDQGKPEGVEQEGQRPIADVVRDNTRQGPLESGGYLHIGTFRDIVERVAKAADIELQGYRPTNGIEFQWLTIQLIGIYGPEDLPMGAERSFKLHAADDQCDLTPDSWDTKHQNSRLQRYRLRRKLKTLNESPFRASSGLQQAG